jgi:drug/metabolite transporter (DMT)-like permease
VTSNQRGILYMTLGMAGFAAEDALIKLMAETLPTGQILLMLGLGGGAFFAGFASLRGHPMRLAQFGHWAVLGRNAAEMLGSLAFVMALSLAPLVTVSAIFQATPLAVTMGAALCLGERVGWRRWSAILVGFAGVMVVIRPGAADVDPGALLAVVAVLGLAARDLFTRRIPRGIDTMWLTAWGFFAVALAGGVQASLLQGWVAPSGRDLWLIAGALSVGTAGYWWVTESTRVAELSVVMPFRYTRLLFALVIAFFVFAEVPDGWTATGTLLIVGSGLYAVMRERALARAGRVALATLSPRDGAR